MLYNSVAVTPLVSFSHKDLDDFVFGRYYFIAEPIAIKLKESNLVEVMKISNDGEFEIGINDKINVSRERLNISTIDTYLVDYKGEDNV